MASHSQTYKHLVGKNVDEAVEALKAEGVLNFDHNVILSLVKYSRYGTTCLSSLGVRSTHKS